MITYREINESYFEKYDIIPILVDVKSILTLEKAENGLRGLLLKEMPVKEYLNDFGIHAKAIKYTIVKV